MKTYNENDDKTKQTIISAKAVVGIVAAYLFLNQDSKGKVGTSNHAINGKRTKILTFQNHL